MRLPVVSRRRYEADIAAVRSETFRGTRAAYSPLRAPTRERVLAYIQACPYSPTIREIMAEVGLASPASVQRHLDRLEADGLIGRGGPDSRVYPIFRGEVA